jgi:hypothetical protein
MVHLARKGVTAFKVSLAQLAQWGHRVYRAYRVSRVSVVCKDYQVCRGRKARQDMMRLLN